jgi:site-specific DNA recombinase
MPIAIGYVRLSVEDSSNSIPNQRRRVEEYCNFNKLELRHVFVDDGKSGWNFDRPGFIEMEGYCKTNKDVQYLIVPHFDRFSRADPIDAMVKEKYLRDKLGVKVLQVSEPVDIDTNSSSYQIVRFMQAFAANEELMRIRDRTRSGMHYLSLEGRHANNAPTGYKNARDENNKPILIVDQEKSAIIKKVFKEFIKGASLVDCRRIAALQGLKITGNSTMQKILSNPIYMGKIKVAAFKGQPEKMVNGLHAPLITEGEYWAASDILSGHNHHFHARDEVPLRGALHCHCGKKMTAGPSRSKSGKYYWYYYCENHRKTNLSAIKLHESFYQILETLSFNQQEIDYLKEMITAGLNEMLKARGGQLMQTRHAVGKIETQIEAAEERFLLQGDISEKTYKKVMNGLQAEKGRLQRHLVSLEDDSARYWEQLEKVTPLLGDLKTAFEKMDASKRMMFIKTVFEPNLYYGLRKYRTQKLHDIFADKELILKEKGLVEFDQPLSENREISACSP